MLDAHVIIESKQLLHLHEKQPIECDGTADDIQ